MRPWWDPAQGTWSDQPFYTSIPVYKVKQGEAFYSGCPMGLGFAEVGFRTTVGTPDNMMFKKPYVFAMLMAKRTPTIGPQFMITAKPIIPEEGLFPMGTCGTPDVIAKLAGVNITPTGIPVDEVVVKSVTITR
jgi:hypothetical protein